MIEQVIHQMIHKYLNFIFENKWFVTKDTKENFIASAV